MQRSNSQAGLSRYRLIDSGCEPHRQLDGQYTSLEEAIADAIAWVDGNWRTCRLPGPLLCPLLCELPG
jgi:hypothetical protein